MRRFITMTLFIGIACGCIVAALGSSIVGAAVDEPSASLYVSYADRDTIDVFDLVTHKVVRTIKGIPDPHGMSFSPDGRRFYAASESTKEGEKVLGVVDQMTGKIIKMVPLTGVAHGSMVITKDGKRLFVPIWYKFTETENATAAMQSGGALDVIDTTTLERVKSIPMKSGMHDIYLTPDGKYVVAGSEEGHFLSVVDVQTEQQVWNLDFDSGVLTIAVEAGADGSTSRLFVMRRELHGFDVVDFTKRKVVAEIALPENDKFRARTSNPAQLAHGIEIAPDDKTLWANCRWGEAVYVYSLPDLKLLGNVGVGKNPNWIAFSPDSKTVYDGNSGEHSLSVIDARTLHEVGRIPLEFTPRKFYSGPLVTLH
jgi:DNA-binding beta-propeller fold protein YncE